MVDLIYGSVSKRIKSIIIILIQLIISTTLLLNLTFTLRANNINENTIKKNIQVDRTLVLAKSGLFSAYAGDDILLSKDLPKIDKYLGSDESVEAFGGYSYTNYQFKELLGNEKYIEINKKEWKKTIAEDFPGASLLLYFDKSLYRSMNLEIDSGEGFSAEKFDEQNILPLIVGNSYKDVLSVGQIITDGEGVKYKVIGFLKKGSTWLSDKVYYRDLPVNLDTYFLMPRNIQNNFHKDSYIITTTKNYMVKLKSAGTVQRFTKDINKFAKEENIKLDVTTTKSNLNEVKKSNMDYLGNIAITSVFVLVFVIIINSISLMSEIESRKYEFAVRITQGASYRYLMRYLIIENLLILVIANAISISLCMFKGSGKFIFIYLANKIDSFSIVSTVVISFIGMMLSIIIPIIKVKEINPSELLRGE